MIYHFSPYILTPMVGGTPKEGALLKVTWPGDISGYADIFPSPELGDASITSQIDFLKEKKVTKITKQTLWFAKRDAEARVAKKSLYNPTLQLRNNFLVTDIAKYTTDQLDHLKKSGFTTLKIKVGADLEKELAFIKKVTTTQNFLVRLDFNLKGSLDILKNLNSQLTKPQASLVQYIEDPFSYESKAWKEARTLFKIAMDFESEKLNWDPAQKPEADLIVMKPSRRDVEKALECFKVWNMNFTITSTMDHPVGIVHALSLAQELRQATPKQMQEPGLMTMGFYKMQPYIASLPTKGPFITPSNDHGIGFTQLLEKEPWIKI